MSKLQEHIQGINYSSIKEVGVQVRDLGIKEHQISYAMSYAIGLSETKAYRLARGMLQSTDSLSSFEKESEHLISWAKNSGSKERKIIAKVIRKDKGAEGDIYLIHQISTMNKRDARAFIKDYLNSGGDTQAISAWLSMAGDVLKRLQRGESLATRSIWGWVKKKVVSLGSAVSDAVSTIGDALAKAGKSLVDAVGSVLKWSVEKIGDFVVSLIEAGSSIGDILKAALEKGFSAIKKFVGAILNVGKSIAEVLKETIGSIFKQLSKVLHALLDIGKSIADIVKSVLKTASTIMGRVLQTLFDIGKSIGNILKSVLRSASQIVGTLLRHILKLRKSIGDILYSVYRVASNIMVDVVKALLSIRKTVAELLNEAMKRLYNGAKLMISLLVRLGKNVTNIIKWGINKGRNFLNLALENLIKAGKKIVDIFSDIVSGGLNIIHRVFKYFIGIGKRVVSLVSDALEVGVTFLRNAIKVIGKITGALAKFASEVLNSTYHTVANLVKKLLHAGLWIGEVLAMLAGRGYLLFRRVINGIIKHTGRVGEVLDWVLTQTENGLSKLWHETLLAVRYAKGKLTDAVDWAFKRGAEMVETILIAWESVEENLVDFYAHATTLMKQGAKYVYHLIGKATVKIGNSVSYVLHYLEKDYIPGVRDFIKGILDVGYELGHLVINLVGVTYKVLVEVVKETLEYGVTLGDLLIESIKNPEDILDNIIKAVEELGKSLRDIYSVILDAGDRYVEEVTLTLHRMKKPAKDILGAVAKISAGAVGTVAAILLNTLASYRQMSVREIMEARKVYGSSLDYANIYFSEESFSNDILRAVHGSRAFVTNNLVNFDTKKPLDNPTMIHELCHVWQYQDSGAFYMAEAIHAQDNEGYNYGYTDRDNGDGAENRLNEMITTHPNLSMKEVFESFNREQQAQIVMHYYVRRFQNNPSLNYDAWKPYRSVVYS